MKFHGILMTRDAADLIEQSLRHALTWADFLYVCDTGSNDGTWDLIQAAAARDARIFATRWDKIVFHEGVRAVIVPQYRKMAKDGDWFARVDRGDYRVCRGGRWWFSDTYMRM